MTQLDVDQKVADGAPKLGRRRDPAKDQQILDAAIEVLSETGFDGMTIDMVAARAGAGKATVYRRWASKNELVLDAVACLKKGDLDAVQIPDTGTLRGDLVGMIRPPTIDDAERKLKIMAGLASMLSSAPDLADAANEAIVEPRARINRMLLKRAVERGEIAADIDIQLVSLISPSMVAYRSLLQRKPVSRDFLITLIDGVILPAVGLRAAPAGSAPVE
ncbi:TetR/AcrR family transcriptional regulator [Agreia pratensis]|uniref:Transcriptional regulator, TetR family n=1 Tax=Agreia pratensis TaxID=150121 RepID=A0A1X7ITU9_9MICO|nr:TetR/AcrR family transcriptional regulator [Agreia pratensis]MBF4632849.1 TetR/AcrR family transcriptional regulator [Agreia pratensis]SMG18294.1 transcriptional regulator, TetR family [Agreia pratensis]